MYCHPTRIVEVFVIMNGNYFPQINKTCGTEVRHKLNVVIYFVHYYYAYLVVLLVTWNCIHRQQLVGSKLDEETTVTNSTKLLLVIILVGLGWLIFTIYYQQWSTVGSLGNCCTSICLLCLVYTMTVIYYLIYL